MKVRALRDDFSATPDRQRDPTPPAGQGRFLEVKLVGKRHSNLASKQEAKRRITEVVIMTGKKTTLSRYRSFRVKVKRKRKLVAIVKFLHSSDASHCLDTIAEHPSLTTWHCVVRPQCFQRRSPFFQETYEHVKAPNVFKDRDEFDKGWRQKSLNAKRAYNETRRRINGFIATRDPAKREALREKRRLQGERKRLLQNSR